MIWIAAMTALVYRDVLPFWTAQDSPAEVVSAGQYQVGISDDRGVRFGTTWVSTTITQSIGMVNSTTLLDLGAMSGLLHKVGPLLLESNLTYLADQTLDRFTFQLQGDALQAKVDGERYGRDYACTIEVGPISRTISLDGRLSGYLGESLRPFTHLKGLRVGQQWRIRLLDPFSLIHGETLEFKTQLASITGRETIRHRNAEVACFRIETEGTVAWADEDGRVVRQEVRMPVLGRFVLTEEPFDRAGRAAAAASTVLHRTTR